MLGFEYMDLEPAIPALYPQLELLPLTVYNFEFPYIQEWYDL